MVHRAGLVAILLAFAGPAAADFDPDAFPPYERCALCHGLFGVSANARFPNLAGQEPVYLENQIRAFLARDRHNDGGQMVDIVSELQPEDIAVVVEWFSTQEPPQPESSGNDKGRALYEARNCGACHDSGTRFLGVPHLSAQHSGYLTKQMKDFRDGRRGTHLGCLPHGPMMPVDDAEIEAIASHLASMERQ